MVADEEVRGLGEGRKGGGMAGLGEWEILRVVGSS
jgi:hypothetical protein